MSLFCYALLCVHSTFAITLKRKRKLFALLLLSYRCIVTTNVLWLFLTVPWVGLQCVIVVRPDHTHLLFENMLGLLWKLTVLSLQCNKARVLHSYMKESSLIEIQRGIT